MKRFIFGIVVLALISSCTNKGKISVENSKKDVDFLFSYVEQIHVNPYHTCSRDSFVLNVQSMKEELDSPIDTLQMWLKLSKLAASLKDGGLFVDFPFSYYKKNNNVLLPFKVDVSANAPYITMYDSVDSLRQNPIKVVSIEGVRSEDIVNNISKYVSANDELQLYYNMSFQFSYLYPALYPIKEGKVNLSIYKGGELVDTTVTCFKADRVRFYNSQEGRLHGASTQMLGNAIVFDVDDLGATKIQNDLNEFLLMFNDSTNLNVGNLIIDLRNCREFNDDFNDDLLNNIIKGEYVKNSNKSLVKSSLSLRKNLSVIRTQLMGGGDLNVEALKFIKEIDRVLECELGDTCRSCFSILKSYGTGNPNFNGKIFVLLSSDTWGSACDIAQLLKVYANATLIGEDTKQSATQYKNLLIQKLPITKFNAFIPCSQDMLPDTHSNVDGIKVDVNVNALKAMQYVEDNYKLY